MSEIVFAIGDVLSYINNRAFEQVGEFVGKNNIALNNRRGKLNEGLPSQIPIDPNIFLGAIESVELLLESLAELYAMKYDSQSCKWAVVSTLQFFK